MKQYSTFRLGDRLFGLDIMMIREINRKPVTSMKDFDRAASDLKKGQTVLVLVNRRGASLYLSAKI